MKERLVLLLYRALLPVLFILAFPGWIVKMIRRGGFGTGLNERIGLYFFAPDFEPSGAVHLHSVSVGETAIALKLLRAWKAAHPSTRFVLATGTSTGHELATKAAIPDLRITYIPLDFPWMIRSYLRRFEPSTVVLIESEIWPNFLRLAEKRHIPVHLANARTSPRSARRLTKFAPILRPFFSRLTSVCIQDRQHAPPWLALGIPPDRIHLTGSIKFDPQDTTPPPLRPDFSEMLAAFGPGRPVILAASTFPGEETMIAGAILGALPHALPVIVPRHAERRHEVAAALTAAGFQVTLRTAFTPPAPAEKQAFVIDTTGELATWTSHADAVIIGKSFLAIGGQNPAEAILAGKPLILGPHMENFQPLVADLIHAQGAITTPGPGLPPDSIRTALDPEKATALTTHARRILSTHEGATMRHLRVLHPTPERA